MLVSTALPYFVPYTGFFQKAHQADALVVLDAVQFPRGTTWVSRNRFKNDQGTLWLTVPVWKRGQGLQTINAVRICYAFPWVYKHLASLKTAYAKAPYLNAHIDIWEKSLAARPALLVQLNLALIRYLADYLKLETRILIQSDLGVKGKGMQLLIDICQRLGASEYLVGWAARKHLDATLFRSAGIRLKFHRPVPPTYPQLWGPFIANLSTFDLVFTCGPKARDMVRCGQIDSPP